jgi:hypothetical protein
VNIDDHSQTASGHGRTGGSAHSEGAGPAAAGGGAAADHGAAAATGRGKASAGGTLVERVKSGPVCAQCVGALAILLTIVSTVLVFTVDADIAIAGYALAAIGVIVAAVPLIKP